MTNEKTTRRRRVNFTVLMMVTAMLYVNLIGGFSKTCRFTDVPDNYWAAADIEALAEGGLINGYGDGRFGPENTLSIGHVATIICNAKGHETKRGENGFWAYEAVRYCRDELKCLPDFGEINAENYGGTTTRELALAALVRGLGAKPDKESAKKWTKDDIPDYDQITPDYADAVVQAYNLGMVHGTDDAGTFNPKGVFKRSHICAILNRAGYTEAAKKPDTRFEAGLSGAEIYEEVKSWGLWKEWAPTTSSYKTLTAIDPIYGGIEVCLLKNDIIEIIAREDNRAGHFKGGTLVDAYGNPVPVSLEQNNCVDANGKYVMSSGWSYEARQLVKRIFTVAFPESYEEAYQALLDVMGQKIWELPNNNGLASAIRWLDGRSYDVALENSNYAIFFHIGTPGNTEYYDRKLSGAHTGSRGYYGSKTVNSMMLAEAYELHRG